MISSTVQKIKCIKLGAQWHKKCLKCAECQSQLNLNNLHSFENKPYCQTHVPKVKATTVVDDQMTQHAKASQQVASYAKKENTETQKGTGEKPQGSDAY